MSKQCICLTSFIAPQLDLTKVVQYLVARAVQTVAEPRLVAFVCKTLRGGALCIALRTVNVKHLMESTKHQE